MASAHSHAHSQKCSCTHVNMHSTHMHSKHMQQHSTHMCTAQHAHAHYSMHSKHTHTCTVHTCTHMPRHSLHMHSTHTCTYTSHIYTAYTCSTHTCTAHTVRRQREGTAGLGPTPRCLAALEHREAKLRRASPNVPKKTRFVLCSVTVSQMPPHLTWGNPSSWWFYISVCLQPWRLLLGPRDSPCHTWMSLAQPSVLPSPGLH